MILIRNTKDADKDLGHKNTAEMHFCLFQFKLGNKLGERK